MAELHVGVVELSNVRNHPYADKLDLANISVPDGFQVVLPRDEYKSGDLVVYIPENSQVPAEITDEIGVTGKLSGPGHDVVRAVRLRNEVSLGLVWRPKSWDLLDFDGYYASGENLAAKFGIVKYQAPVPLWMAGKNISAPDLLATDFDVESLRKFGKVFQPGEPIEITEKAHGSFINVTYVKSEDKIYVTSKGVGKQGLAIVEDEHNVYWRVARKYHLHNVLYIIAERTEADRVAVLGEVLGVQDLTYGFSKGELGFAAFDLILANDTHQVWVDPRDYLRKDVPCVPVLYRGPYDRQIVESFVDGKEQITYREEHLREGIVIRSNPRRYDSRLHGPAMLKLVSDAYTMRGKNSKGELPSELQ